MSGYATALDFARHDHPAFPVRGKVPLVGEGGFHKASTDPDTLRVWHNRFPTAGWAVVCGKGFSVVDVDVKHGADVQEVLGLVAGPMVETGQANGSGRGLHIYVAGDLPTGDTALKGVEIRGVGAYVVIPGSPHSSGVTYEWVGDQRPWTPGALAPPPPELAPRRREHVAVEGNGRIPHHARNDTLTSLAGTWRARGVCAEAIYAGLRVVGERQCEPEPNGALPSKREIAAIARSASRWEPGELPGVAEPATLTGGLTDLPRLVAEPPRPVPWVAEGIAARGKLTVLTGAADVGKSWLAIGCCAGVGTGRSVAGIHCASGRALYIDGEMGEGEFSDRLRGLGLTGHEMHHLDAAARGLDLSRPADREAVAMLAADYTLMILDSLRALAPAMRENESDSVGPIVAAIRNIARETGAAIVLLHHRGDSDKPYRGSTAIKDQSDALLSLWPGDDDGIIGLRCRGGKGRVRFAPAPEDVWLRRDPFTGRLSRSVARELPPPSSRTPRRDEIENAALDALPAKSMREVARKLGLRETDSTLTAAWKQLREDRVVVRVGGVWECSAVVPSLGAGGTALHSVPQPENAVYGYEEGDE
jgi:hypothetical protein